MATLQQVSLSSPSGQSSHRRFFLLTASVVLLVALALLSLSAYSAARDPERSWILYVEEIAGYDPLGGETAFQLYIANDGRFTVRLFEPNGNETQAMIRHGRMQESDVARLLQIFEKVEEPTIIGNDLGILIVERRSPEGQALRHEFHEGASTQEFIGAVFDLVLLNVSTPFPDVSI